MVVDALFIELRLEVNCDLSFRIFHLLQDPKCDIWDGVVPVVALIFIIRVRCTFFLFQDAASDPGPAWTWTEAVPWMTDWMGVILLKNLLFLSEMSPDPSILTLYCR